MIASVFAPQSMQRIPVGIDLGTTYSCISHLDRQGEPHTLPNPEGELATPSVVLFEGNDIIVGTEALRNSVAHPERVVQNSKRYMGDPRKGWVIDGRTYRPPDIAAIILRHLLDGAEQQLGPVEHAVITVPAQFSDIQRQQTAEAGLKAGLKKVDIINEPVAAALCYVLGEGLWFAELAADQTVMVYDLGGGTFDLSLVKYNRNEVRVRASTGDLNLGGIDWNRRLEDFACEEFLQQIPNDPRLDKESMQALAIEVEQTKRSLSVRQRASLTVQHAGRRKVFGITQKQFELLTHDLVEQSERITQKLLKDHKLGWAHIDAVLLTGGASRMPMIQSMLKRVSGTTPNQKLSPDQSISHGAAYYAGMLASGAEFTRKTFLSKEATARLATFKQQSVSARALGILVKDKQTGERVPHYLIPANTPLPCAFRQSFGTVADDQRRVHLHIVESGTTEDTVAVKLGACIVDDLPPGLPAATPIEVTIRYDEQARVHVSAVELNSGRSARTSIVREESLVPMTAEQMRQSEASLMPAPAGRLPKSPAPAGTLPQSEASAGKVNFVPADSSDRRVRPQPTRPLAARASDRSESGKSPPAARPPVAGRRGTAAGGRAAAPAPATARKRGSVFAPSVEQSERPIPLCDQCGEAMDSKGVCTACGARQGERTARPAARKPATRKSGPARARGPAPAAPKAPRKRPEASLPPTERMDPQEFQPRRASTRPPPLSSAGEEEFYDLLDDDEVT